MQGKVFCLLFAGIVYDLRLPLLLAHSTSLRAPRVASKGGKEEDLDQDSMTSFNKTKTPALAGVLNFILDSDV